MGPQVIPFRIPLPPPAFSANALGGVVATLLTAALLRTWHPSGEPVPPSLHTARFSVAILSGPKQSAQEAPANTEKTAAAVIATPSASSNQLVTAERETSLPKAVAAAQESAAGASSVVPQEVIPPARVSMPGGRLVAEDVGLGDAPDPFAIGARQVFIRILVGADGAVKRGGIVRSGSDPMRDTLILRAMMSRTYTTTNLIRNEGKEPQWQLDLVIDYGTNEFLP